jgi:acyl dehydratase
MIEGEVLPELVRGPTTRGTLALFAGASHDHVLLHIDSDYARAAGMDDVFAHGMLSMAYLAQALRIWAPAERLRNWNGASPRSLRCAQWSIAADRLPRFSSRTASAARG